MAEVLNPLAASKANRAARNMERLSVVLLASAALLAVSVTFGIIVVLVTGAESFFHVVSVDEFIFGLTWAPLFEPRHFGILPLLAGTLQIAVLGSLLAVPFGILIALFLSEYANQRTRNILKPILELLAGIPSVVFGYFALTAITPLLQNVFPGTEVFNAGSAGIVVGIMNIPMVASLSDDALRAVPRSICSAGYALGATKFEVIASILLPSAASGIMAASILAFARAVGETMAVSLAAGNTPKLTVSPFESIQTMTSYIVQVSMGDTAVGSVEYQSIFAVGLLLFFVTYLVNVGAQLIMRRLRRTWNAA